MKVICIKDCQIGPLGIFREGEVAEIDDGWANNDKVKRCFYIDRSTIRNLKAKEPDAAADGASRRGRLVKALMCLASRRELIGVMMDEGLAVDAVLADESSDMMTEDQRAEALADLHIEYFGYEPRFRIGEPKPAKPKPAKPEPESPDLFKE